MVHITVAFWQGHVCAGSVCLLTSNLQDAHVSHYHWQSCKIHSVHVACDREECIIICAGLFCFCHLYSSKKIYDDFLGYYVYIMFWIILSWFAMFCDISNNILFQNNSLKYWLWCVWVSECVCVCMRACVCVCATIQNLTNNIPWSSTVVPATDWAFTCAVRKSLGNCGTPVGGNWGCLMVTCIDRTLWRDTCGGEVGTAWWWPV